VYAAAPSWKRDKSFLVGGIQISFAKFCLATHVSPRERSADEAENDREPDQPHGHLAYGWLAGV
jgi:hypothetical protein